ncbi:unnamed protein product [Brachionus calyciflorus]|uniref:Uncharacterized protein n=1 Tax=Brachionus calyciflorus TaxID=104777 RepID=A0A814A1R3_9BILA|nr:unnamed protein product [Brachionus calyciflorus]
MNFLFVHIGLVLLITETLIKSVDSIRCLQCFGTNCADTIYPASTQYVDCQDGVKFCLKLVYRNGQVNRMCGEPFEQKCCSNKRIRRNNRTAIQYCCNKNVCNKSSRLSLNISFFLLPLYFLIQIKIIN